MSPRLDDAVAIGALIQCLMRMLYRLRRDNKRWRQYARFLISENRWRAQRYGTSTGLIDFGIGEVVEFNTLLEELIELIMPDAQALDCVDEIKRLKQIGETGTSADRQLAIYHSALKQGQSEPEALQTVVDLLMDETKEAL